MPFPILILLLLMLLLSGCASGKDLRPTTTSPICEAVVGPIKYNSQKPTSRRFAGPDLAPDLKKRNQIGQNLGCPKYR